MCHEPATAPKKEEPIKNVSAVKGKPGKQSKKVGASQSNQGQRRMTLFDQPLIDGGKFEVLTTSAIDQAKMNIKKKSVLVEGVQDFNFDNFM